MEDDSDQLLLTIPQAAAWLGIGEKAIRRAIRAGELEAIQLAPGGWHRLTKQAIVEWLESKKKGSSK